LSGETIAILAVPAHNVEPQVGATQGSLHVQECILFFRRAFRQNLFRTLPGELGPDYIDLFDILSGIGQDGHQIGLHLRHAASNSKDFLLASPPDYYNAIL
jgi:hypothetical protein